MAAVTELATTVGTRAACRVLFAPRASYYRDRRAACFPAAIALRPRPARALSLAERETVLAHLHGERFQDRSPAAVYATLLDEGHYYCSIRTMHRFLKQQAESRERRDQSPSAIRWMRRTRSCAARTHVWPKICVRRTSSSTSKKKWLRCWVIRFRSRTRRKSPDGRRHRTGHRCRHARRLPCAVCAARFLLPGSTCSLFPRSDRFAT